MKTMNRLSHRGSRFIAQKPTIIPYNGNCRQAKIIENSPIELPASVLIRKGHGKHRIARPNPSPSLKDSKAIRIAMGVTATPINPPQTMGMGEDINVL